MANKKKPVWREKRGEFPYYRPSWVARLNGCTLEVKEFYGPTIGSEGLDKWWFFAERAKGNGARFHNSLWKYDSWDSREAAQSAAEQYARESPPRA